MSGDKMNLEDYVLRFKNLLSSIEAVENDGWVRPAVFMNWVDKYNNLVRTFNSDYSRKVQAYGISDDNFSSSKKTITKRAVMSLKRMIENLEASISAQIKQQNEEKRRFHCFKINHQCPHKIDSDKYKFFVGMPFDNRFTDAYEFGIKMPLTMKGVNCDRHVFRADEKFENVDIMCKICRAIQESRYVIVDISSANPNVMFELGLAYGLNKQVFLLKEVTTSVVSDLKGLEYIEYENAVDLNRKLLDKFQKLGIL